MSIFGKTDAERKACPVLDGAVMYFPRAIAAIARHSLKANEKHNPGEPLHWDRHKSSDQLNTALRHIMDFKMGVVDDGEYDNLTAAGWRVLAALETELERREGVGAVAVSKIVSQTVGTPPVRPRSQWYRTCDCPWCRADAAPA